MAARNERLYIVTYDTADQKRWRRVFRVMEAYGHWLQLSVFQCRLTARRPGHAPRPRDQTVGGPSPDP